MRFPTIGSDWILTEEQLITLRETYPGLDVVRECQKAMLWLTVNPTRRKTAKGMPRFLVSWLNRADKGGDPVPKKFYHSVRLLPVTHEWLCPHTPPCGNRVTCGVVSQRKGSRREAV